MTEKAQTPFRVGGVYRDGDGDLFRIARVLDEEQMIASTESVILSGELMPLGINGGTHYLTTGEWIMRVGQVSSMHLLPGELHQVDGEWVAVEEKSPEQKFDEAVARVRDVLEKESNAAMIARDEARSQEAKVWALMQHIKELRTRESAPKSVGPTVHAPMAALQLCADLEPRGYLR